MDSRVYHRVDARGRAPAAELSGGGFAAQRRGGGAVAERGSGGRGGVGPVVLSRVEVGEMRGGEEEGKGNMDVDVDVDQGHRICYVQRGVGGVGVQDVN